MSLVVKTDINPGFKDLNTDEDYTFLTCMIGGNAYSYFASVIAGDTAVVHFYFKSFKLSTLKAALLDWEEIKKRLKSDGVKKMVTINKDEPGSKWSRFLVMFGFCEPETIKISSLEI